MKKIIYTLFIIIGVGMISCSYLDVVPDNVATIEYAFRNRASTERFLYTCYGYLPREGDVSWDVAMAGATIPGPIISLHGAPRHCKCQAKCNQSICEFLEWRARHERGGKGWLQHIP